MLTLLPALLVPAGAAALCVEDATHLCLQGERFRVAVEWANPYPAGGRGVGKGVELTGEAGYFWFFTRDNIELTVKVVDGRRVNGSFWVFYASMSTVEFTLSVTDTETGWQRSYRNPPFAQTTGADTEAFPEDLLSGRVLFVGAHPDDEVILAPLLGELCVERGQPCTLLVATRGENGPCLLPEGCRPGVAAVRRRELERAVAYLGAELEPWELPDRSGPDPRAVRRAWADAAGGEERVVQRLAAALEAAAPGAVLLFDPRHGSTGHPAHRALGDLVLEALEQVPPPRPAAYLLETRVEIRDGGGTIVFSPALPGEAGVFGFDATRPAPAAGGTAWGYLLELAALYPSQLDERSLAALGAVPAGDRRVLLLPAGELPEAGEHRSWAP